MWRLPIPKPWGPDTRSAHYHLVMPDGATNALVIDIAIMHRIQPPLSHAIVTDVLRHHADLARAGRLIPVALPILPFPNQQGSNQ